MEQEEAMRYLLKDGNLSVPCSRYGRNTLECAEVAYQVALIVQDDTGEDMTTDSLDADMGMVVNDSAEPADLLRKYRSFLELEGLVPAYNKIPERDAEELTNDMLDECNPDVVIHGMTFLPSRVLKECDPTAYREVLLTLIDALGFRISKARCPVGCTLVC